MLQHGSTPRTSNSPPPTSKKPKKTKQYGVFLLPRASTSWLHFRTTQTLAVNRAPIKSRGTIQRLERPALSFSSSPRAPWQLHACALAEVKAVTSEGTVKSLPALEDVGVLPTITQMFPISWASPRRFQRHLCER